MQQTKLYTDLAEVYDLYHQKHLNYSKIAKLIDKYLKKYRARKILHVGSGPGRLSKILSDKYKFQVHLLDNSREMIGLSSRLLPNLPHTLADMRDFYLDEEFDAVILAAGTFPHLLTEEDVKEALEKFHDSLKIGGVLIFDNIHPKKLIEGKTTEEKKEIKNNGKSITQYSKVKIVEYEPTIAKVEVSLRILGKGTVEFEEYSHLFRAYGQEEIKKLLEDADFEFLEFAEGVDPFSYFTIARAD